MIWRDDSSHQLPVLHTLCEKIAFHQRPVIYSYTLTSINMQENLPTIAIVDDQELCRQIARKMMNRLDFPVILEACNGQDFFEKLASLTTSPDICLLDLEMPLMDGFETARQLKKRFPGVRILAWSSNAGAAEISRILACGVYAFLPKDSAWECWRDKMMEMVSVEK